jgi:hypothetical protein
LSRFVNLDTFTDPPLTFGHTTPAIAYTSGMFSLPSAAACPRSHPGRHRAARSAWRGSVFGYLGSIDQSIDEQSIARIGAIRQGVDPSTVLIIPCTRFARCAQGKRKSAGARASTPRVRTSSGRGRLKYIK